LVFKRFIDISTLVEKIKYCRNDFELTEDLNVSEDLLKQFLNFYGDEVNRLIAQQDNE